MTSDRQSGSLRCTGCDFGQIQDLTSSRSRDYRRQAHITEVMFA